MKKLNMVLVGEIVLALAWVILALLFQNFQETGFYYWGGFAFGLITFIVIILVTLFWKTKTLRNTTELGYLPVYFGWIYVIVSISVNSKFLMLKGDGPLKKLLVGLNLLLLLIYLFSVYCANKYAERVVAQTEQIIGKTEKSVNLSVQLAGLLSMAKDEDVKKRLYALKERLDYSSNMTQNFTAGYEKEFGDVLHQVEEAIVNGSDQSEIIALVEKAEQLWNIRNAKNSAVK